MNSGRPKHYLHNAIIKTLVSLQNSYANAKNNAIFYSNANENALGYRHCNCYHGRLHCMIEFCKLTIDI